MGDNSEFLPGAPAYIDFPHIEAGTKRDGKPVLNRWSGLMTEGHNFPGAKVALLYNV